MTATLPGGMEYKNLMTAAQEVADGEWGSQFPEEDGVRNLIVAVTGVRDEVGDIIVPGAFEHTLQRIEPKGCMGHDWNRVTGYPEAIEEVMPGDPRLPKTDRHGKPWPAEAGALFVRHRYHTDTEDGQRAYKDARFLGPRLACSIGYVDPKDENGRPLYSYKKIDPKSGLMTRFLPRLDLFEYSQVLHGAHLLAGGIKDGKPKRMERKQRPAMELKVRLVRDSAYWGLPLGTPIRPGMRPQGPKARRIVAAGQQADENAGAVEVDANSLRIKPTAKGKQKGQIAVGDAYSGIMGLLGDDDADPFDESFLTDDTQKINKGEAYNPLDILVANAVPPADVEDQLRNNSDWDQSRLGDSADRQDEIDRYVADVVDAYREKYNAELVRQNDTGDSEVPDPDAAPAATSERPPPAEEPVLIPGGLGDGVAPATDSRTVNEVAEDDKYQRATERFNAAQAATPGQEEARQRAENNRAAAQRGELPLRRGENAPAAQPAPAEPSGPTRISAEDQAEITRLKQDGRDNEAAKLYREAVQRAREAEGITPESASPNRARLRQQMDTEASAPTLEDGRALQPVDPDRSETEAFELTGDNGATLRVYSLRRPSEVGKPWAYDITGPDGEIQEGEGLYQSAGSALVRAEADFHKAEGRGADGNESEPLPGSETGSPEPSIEDVPETPSGESTVEPGAAPDTVGEPLGETDPALDGQPAEQPAPEPEPTEEITPEEIADTDEAIDASFGVTEAPDGEFEADADIADRQDRVATLLAHSEAGSLDLSPERVSDDQLRTTRADVVDELRLQEHLERRRAGERAVSRQRAAQEAAEQADTTTVTDGDTAEPEEDTGPKPRPGVTGAAEDLADALDDGDQARIEAATARLRSSVNRSRSDSEVVAEIRAMLDGPLDAETLRDAAARLRDEQRAKRNEGARRRRTARRFERERLRSLLGQVETEMRNRNLDFDPIPDDDGTVTLDTPAPVVGWTVENRAPDWANTSTRVETLEGAGYRATITTGIGPGGKPRPFSDYQWSVIDDNGTTLASAKGSVADSDTARTLVEIALAAQQRLGLIPVDSQIPQDSVPENTSATPLADVVDALDDMRARIIDGRKLNPVTGQPDPFAQGLSPLPEPTASRFAGADAGEVREYLENNGPRRDGRPVFGHYRWDTAQLTPGGWFAVVDDMSGKPQVVHTLTGGTFNPDMSVGALGRADLMRYAEIAETLPDSDGRTADWGLKADELRDSFNNRDFGATAEWGGAFRDFQASIVHRLTREKIAAGQFTHKLVRRDLAFSSGATNPSRKFYVSEMHRSLTPLVAAGKRQPNAFDKKTLDAAVSARTLAAMGAPDAAAVLLNRRAAEVRDEYGPDAPDHGSLVLDSLARGYLGMFSPMRSPGERVQSIKPGEQLFLSVGEGEPPRAFRALGAPRRDAHSTDMIVPVIDERGGDQKFLRTSTTEIRIEDTERPRYGFNPLSAALGGERGAFIVVGPGEEPPQTDEDVKARMFADADAVPQDVLDAAAEALPQPRRSAPRPAAQSRRAPAAPRARRTAPEPSAPEPVPGQQHLAQAQARTDARFLGMPFSIGGAPERGSFDSIEAARAHLEEVGANEENRQMASSARATAAMIDDGTVKLSPGGVFLVGKDGNISHVSSGLKVWPPAQGSANKPMFDDLYAGGLRYNQTTSMRVARALESGVFDGEQLDWSGNGMAAVRQSRVIAERNGGFHPMQTAQRAAYRDGVLGAAKPTRTDVAMFGGMAGQLGLEGPNPEALDSSAVLNHRIAYEGREGFDAVTKKGADIGKQVGVEMELAESLAKTAPLDAVRRLTALADRLEGEKVVQRPRVAGRDETERTLTPSEDLRAVAKMITDMHDPDKISESGRFRKADMVGQVEPTKPKITMGRSWEDPGGIAARRLESDIRESGGIRFYRDADGNLHATFNNGAGVPVDIADGNIPVNGTTTGAIKVTDNGRITLSYLSANRLIVIDLPPGSWKFTPEGGDADAPETTSGQAGAGDGVDVTGDIEEIRRLASDEPAGDGGGPAGTPEGSADESPEIAEARAELARLEAAAAANFNAATGGFSRQARRSNDARLRRGASYEREIQAARRRLDALLSGSTRSETASSPAERVTPERLRDAAFIRTKTGWHEVVRVSPKSVTVKTGYSWNDRIPVGSIIDVRTHDEQRQAESSRSAETSANEPADTESKIRQVYAELADGPQDWVPLRELRRRLSGMDKAEVDRVLVEMTRTGSVHLVPDSNRKVLTDEDRAAAIRIGGEDKHLIAIEEDDELSAGTGPEAVDTPEAVEAKVREVYAELATEPQDWIRLARIRARLGGADRELVDEALRQMMRSGTVHLAPESNTKVLTDADRAAALREGSEDLHLIAIEE